MSKLIAKSLFQTLGIILQNPAERFLPKQMGDILNKLSLIGTCTSF